MKNQSPDTPAWAQDRRGAIALMLMTIPTAGVISAALAMMNPWDGRYIAIYAGPFGFACLTGGLLRLVFGRVMPRPGEQLELHRQKPPSFWRNLSRFIGLIFDVGLSLAVGGIAWGFADDYVIGGQLPELTGSWPDGMRDLAGYGVFFLFTSGYLLIPAAVFGATPAMLLFGLRWVRRKDGQRIGALNAFIRILATLLFTPIHFVLFVLGIFFGGRKMKRITIQGNSVTSQRYFDYSGFTWMLHTWRSLADVVARSETLKPVYMPAERSARWAYSKKNALATCIVLVVVSAVAVITLGTTRVDRLLARFAAVDSLFYEHDDDVWAELADNAHIPAVQAEMARQLGFWGKACWADGAPIPGGSSMRGRQFPHIAVVMGQHQLTPDDALRRAVVATHFCCGSKEARVWLPDFDTDPGVAKALRYLLVADMDPGGSKVSGDSACARNKKAVDAIFGELQARGVEMDEKLVEVAVVYALHSGSEAAASFLKNGFSGGEPPLRAWIDKFHLRHFLQEAHWPRKSNRAEMETLGRRLIASPPAQVSSEFAGRVASLYGSEENKALWFQLAQALGSDGLRMIELEAGHNPAAVRLAKALGKVSPGAVDTLLKQLIWPIKQSSWKELPDKQAEVAAELVGLGSSIVPSLRQRIGHGWGTGHDR